MKQFPIVRASGSHYEVGLTIGKTMRSAIANLLARNKDIFKEEFATYIQESALFLKQTEKYYPGYVEELRGIADGASVSFQELFLSNNREVADFDPFLLDPNHCTIIGIPQGNRYLIGHNEDWDRVSLEALYLLDAIIEDNHIFGLNYANNIIGDSVAINASGLVQAVNELFHQDAQLGVPKNFIARAILDCKTLEETESIMRTIPRAAGYNHVLAQRDRLWNIESSAKEYVIEKIKGEKYVHTNHYLTELKRIDRGNKESLIRYEKVRNILTGIMLASDIKRVLSDRTEPYICRDGTIGSVIFDVPNKVAHIAYGQPTQESYVEYSLKHVLQ